MLENSFFSTFNTLYLDTIRNTTSWWQNSMKRFPIQLVPFLRTLCNMASDLLESTTLGGLSYNLPTLHVLINKSLKVSARLFQRATSSSFRLASPTLSLTEIS